MVLHGMGGNESHDAGLYGFPPQLETAIRDGKIPPSIVVFPNGGNGYTSRVERMILNEVLPEVERSYRTRPQRAVCGFSMGARAASKWLIDHSDIFQVAVAWGGGPSSNLVASAGRKALKKSHSLWVVCGDQDPARSVKPTVERLSANLAVCRFTLLPEVGHELGKYHQQTAQEAFKFISESWARLGKPR